MSTTMQRLSGSISSPSVLTGRLGIAFMPAPTGDATASADDILVGETAYIATGKVTGTYTPLDTSDGTAIPSDILDSKIAYVDGERVIGTCLFDADTSDGTATEGDIRTGTSAYVNGAKLDGSLTPLDTSSATATASDILMGKTAYISDGTEATGTCDFNADTTDATAVENSLLYGHTAYGSAGTKLTGTGAYWQEFVVSGFFNSTYSGNITLSLPKCTSAVGMFRNSAATEVDITFSSALTSLSDFARFGSGNDNLTTLHLRGDISNVTNTLNMVTLRTKLVTFTMPQNNMKVNISFNSSTLLSTASLLSIANGIGAAITLTLHATSKTNCDNIMVDNVAGVAVLGSAMSLSAFITNIKGATIA